MPSTNENYNLIAVIGPTASGKTKLAVQLAQLLGGEIISADSRQVYRGLDIGSGKDLQEYGSTPYHLIDIVDPGYEFNIFEYQQRFVECFNTLKTADRLPILCGGSALYVDAVLRGYRLIKVDENPELRQQLNNKSHKQLAARLLELKPQQHNTTDLIDRDRLIRAIEIAEGELAVKRSQTNFPELQPLIFAIQFEPKELRQRITQRLKQRMDEGLIKEVENLHQQGVSWETLHFYGLEYRYAAQYLQGELNKNDFYQKLNSAIHQFAKKQRTWLRRLEREQVNLHWLDGGDDLLEQAKALL